MYLYSRCDAVVVRFDFRIRIECQGAFACDHRFRFAHMLFVEQKLTVQIADIDRVQINLSSRRETERESETQSQLDGHEVHCMTYDFDVGKSSHHQILQHLASDAAGTNHQHFAFVDFRLKR